MFRTSSITLAALWIALVFAASCDDDTSNDDGDGAGHPENTGDSCVTPEDCYPGIDQQELEGDVLCLERVEDGYCTHECQTDDDCCTVEGECDTDHPQVCGPFESTGLMLCFLSCESEDIGDKEDNEYCREFGDIDFICRSTGGGSDNRKVCVPGGNGSCTVAEDCTGDWPYCCLDNTGDARFCYSDLAAETRDCLE